MNNILSNTTSSSSSSNSPSIILNPSHDFFSYEDLYREINQVNLINSLFEENNNVITLDFRNFNIELTALNEMNIRFVKMTVECCISDNFPSSINTREDLLSNLTNIFNNVNTKLYNVVNNIFEINALGINYNIISIQNPPNPHNNILLENMSDIRQFISDLHESFILDDDVITLNSLSNLNSDIYFELINIQNNFLVNLNTTGVLITNFINSYNF